MTSVDPPTRRALRRERSKGSSTEVPRADFAVQGASESARFFGADADEADEAGSGADRSGRSASRGGGGGEEGTFDYSGRSGGSLHSGRISDGNPLLDDSAHSLNSSERSPGFRPTAVKNGSVRSEGNGSKRSGRSGESEEHRTLLAAGQGTAQGGSRTEGSPAEAKNHSSVRSDAKKAPTNRAGPFGSAKSDDDDLESEDNNGPLTPQDIEEWHSAQSGSNLGGSLPSLGAKGSKDGSPESSPDSTDAQGGSFVKRNVNFNADDAEADGGRGNRDKALAASRGALAGSAFTTATASSDDTRPAANTAATVQNQQSKQGTQSKQGKPYFNLSKPEERKQFMEMMDGNGGGLVATGEADVERGNGTTYNTTSPLFEAADQDEMQIRTYKTRSSGTHHGGAALGGRDDVDPDDEESGEHYASMQELLADESGGLERGIPRRRGRFGGCATSIFGEKGSKGRKVRMVAVMGLLVACAVAVGVYLAVGPTGSSADKRAEGGQLQASEGVGSASTPTVAPSRPKLEGANGSGALLGVPTGAPSASLNRARTGSPSRSPTMDRPTPLPTVVDDYSYEPTTYAPTGAIPSPTRAPQGDFGTGEFPQGSSSPSPSSSLAVVDTTQPCSICPDGIEGGDLDPAECMAAIDAYASYVEGSEVCEQGKIYRQICCPSALESVSANATDANATDANANNANATDANVTEFNATSANATWPCSICPGGIDAAEGDAVECQDAVDAYASYVAGSDVCEQGKEWQAICCPSEFADPGANATSLNSTDSGVNETDSNATAPCYICPNGIDAAGGDIFECQDAIDAYSSYDAGSDVCEQGKEWQPICCPSAAEQPCSICPGGVDVVSILESGQYNETQVEDCREKVELAQTLGETSATCEEYEAHQSTCCPSEVKVPCSICPNGVDAASLLEAGGHNETDAEDLAASCQESIKYHAQFDEDSFECANRAVIESDCCPATGVDNGTTVVIWGPNDSSWALGANATNGTEFNSTADGSVAANETLAANSSDVDGNATSFNDTLVADWTDTNATSSNETTLVANWTAATSYNATEANMTNADTPSSNETLAANEVDETTSVDANTTDGNITTPVDANATDASTTTPATLPAATNETTEASCASIVDIAVSDERFSTLFAALTSASLVDALSGEGPLTVFAPTNEAFAALPEGTVEALLDDPVSLSEVLKHHVIAANYLSSFLETSEVETLSGDYVAVTVSDDGAMTIDGANVAEADIVACNGVIHVIDKVLLPPAVIIAMPEATEASNETTDLNETIPVNAKPDRIPRDAVNWALYGVASQSSTCFGATAERAIDGGRSPYMGAKSIAHTCPEESPWWQVDLGQPLEVGHVLIMNRWDDCCRDKLNDVEVQILKSSGKVLAARPIVNGLKEFHVSFDPPVKGRFVRVQKNIFGALSLAEMLVYSEVYAIPNLIPDDTNATVTASSITPGA